MHSPLLGVTDNDWARFVALCKGNDPGEVSPSLQLGLFNVGFLRLRDLGLTENVRRVRYNGREVWGGDFKPPLTMRGFLSDPRLQYRVFVEDIRDRATLVSPFRGTLIDGKKATLSGLIAVAKLAGRKGFLSWAKDPTERKKYPQTSKAFEVANGIF